MKLRSLDEDVSPKLGIWYYIYLKPKWKLITLPRKLQDKNYLHVNLWQTIVVDVIQHYTLDGEESSIVRGLPYAFPRGRVDFKEPIDGRPLLPSSIFVLYHGDDFPSPLDKQEEIRNLINDFDLISFKLASRVENVFNDHETILKKHKDKMQEIIGEIPY